MGMGILLFHKSEQKVGLSDGWVADNDNFGKKVVLLFFKAGGFTLSGVFLHLQIDIKLSERRIKALFTWIR